MRLLVRSVACACVCALAVPAAATAAPDPLRPQQFGLDILESDAAHATATGTGATIAIIDTGVFAGHPDLASPRLLAGRDFVDGDDTPQDDVDGHGTHVTGIAGATEGNGIGIASVAPGARLLPVRVLGNDGSGTVDDVVAGIDYAVAQGADIINLSLGGDSPVAGSAPQFDAAINRALDADRVVIAASGNNGLPACAQPSGGGRLLCVGSVDENRQRSFFSNFGTGLGLMAPGGAGLFGRDILSTYNRDNAGFGGFYEELAGTSQATPHVAGVAALLVEKGLRGQPAVQRILATAADAGPAGPDPEYGAGIVNARRAVEGLPVQPAPGADGGLTGTSTPPGSAARISFRRAQGIRTVLRRGIRVRCRAAGAGRCRVRASRRGRRLAAGSVALQTGRSAVAVARLSRSGRALLRRALRRRSAVTLRVRVTLPGAPPQLRTLRLRP